MREKFKGKALYPCHILIRGGLSPPKSLVLESPLCTPIRWTHGLKPLVLLCSEHEVAHAGQAVLNVTDKEDSIS